MAWVLLGPEFEAPVLRGDEAVRWPGLWGRGGVAGEGWGGARVLHARPPFAPGPGLATGRHSFKMASQPPRPSSSTKYRYKYGKVISPKYLPKDGRTAPQQRSLQLPLVPGAEGAPGRRRLRWLTLMKAICGFKRLIAEVRRGQTLSSISPLAMGQKMPKMQQMPEKKFWGDQEPLSKVRAALGGGVAVCSPHRGRVRVREYP